MGRDKAFVELGGKTMIERVIERSAELGQPETILITNSPDDYRHLDMPMFTDVLPDKGSLGGIYTALTVAEGPDVLVLACDMPFISTDLLRYMIAQMDDDIDIVVPARRWLPAGPCTPFTRRPACGRFANNWMMIDSRSSASMTRCAYVISTKRILCAV